MKAVSVVILIALGYFLLAPVPCGVPVSYRLGTIDAQFSITEAQAKSALSDAEAVWEDGIGEDIFVYDPEAKLTVNFVYDDRQARTDEEQRMREELNSQKNLSDSIRREYEGYVSEYEDLKSRYERKETRYLEDLEAYNEEVAMWNQKGGAPEEEYEKLSDEQERLRGEEEDLNTMVGELNEYVEKLNEIGVQGEALVNNYNSSVDTYNDTFNTEREFTQGEHEGDEIRIYEYANGTELRIVLAHELGHALSMDHVEGAQSIMYYFMGEQSLENGLTTEDIEGYRAQCSPKWYHRGRYY